ncbi:DUF2325 domain-containing protein [Arcobacter sp. F2176]|uniref:DUF2325 domain-containing protein n=1 Tax=unclassified Arcobacter TaxID=2593671 RepID=UPI00100AC745|nr:DUF2325 domain-containing protein [Arcobacter sp. F2176]RXJ79526.1 hypothetical protein CRU95_13830 [Arcobacter sp. F2176]
MSVLVIGGDKISTIISTLEDLGASSIRHWDARKKSSAPKKKIPQDTDCIIMLTSFLNHNVMHKYKNIAKKQNIPYICTKHSSNCVYDEYKKMIDSNNCGDCDLNCNKRKNENY